MFKKLVRLLSKKVLAYKELLFIGFIVIILLYPLILHPFSIIFPTTDVNIYSAWKIFLVDTFKTFGYIPLWNPYLFGGAPFIGNSQVGIFYPINIIYFLLPVDNVFGYVFILDYIVIGVTTFAFARLIKLSKSASLISGLCMIFNGAVMSQLFLGHIVILDAIVWFPLLLYLYEIAIQKQLFFKPAIISGIIFGFMLLAGNAQIPLYALLSASMYFIIRFFQEVKRGRIKNNKILFLPLITLIIGISLSAIQLIPTFEFSQLSTRNHGLSYEWASAFSFNPKQMLIAIFPSLFGSDVNNTYWGIGSFWGSSIYCGILPLLLALVAFIYKRNKYFYAFLLLFIFACIYSLGKYAPIFKLFYDYIPFFNDFRVPERFLFVYAFSLSIFAGLGMEFILDKFNKTKKIVFNRWLKLVLTLEFVAISICAFLSFSKDGVIIFEKVILRNSYAQGINHYLLYGLIIRDLLTFCIIIFIVILMLFLILKNKLSRRNLCILIILLTSIDYLLFYSTFFKQNILINNNQYLNEIRFIKQDTSKFRVFFIPSADVAQTSRDMLENIYGYDPLYLASYRNFLWEIGPHENTPYENSITINLIKNFNNLKLLNVKYIVSGKKLNYDSLSLVYKNNFYIYRIDDTLPRAFINFAETANSNLDLLDNIQSVVIQDYQPNKILLKTSLNKPGRLILSEIYYPGWKAYDNGKLVKIENSNDIFRSIYLNKGTHTVLFTYDPDSYRIGSIITFTTIILILVALASYVFKKKFFNK